MAKKKILLVDDSGTALMMEKMVLSKRYGITGGKSLTLREIASTMGLSKERVRQIECRAKKRMRAILVGTNGKNT